MNICLLREEDRGIEKVFDQGSGLKVRYFNPDLLGEKVAKPGDTNGGFGIKKPNGKWATLNEQGDWEERDGAIENLRSWETFYPGNPGTVAYRAGKEYWLKTVERP